MKYRRHLLFLAAFAGVCGWFGGAEEARAVPGTITTVAGGGGAGDGGLATDANLSPSGIFVDEAGNLYIADGGNSRIRKVDPSGIITTVAGNGVRAFSGDGGLAAQGSLSNPSDVFGDGAGNLYIAATFNHRVRKVDPTGIITTVAGNGTVGFSGDGELATQASLSSPASVAIDGAGNLYIADSGNNRIRKVDPSGVIATVAGNGTPGFSGDGGSAIQASLAYPSAVFADGAGNLYIADLGNQRVRKVDPSGIITTVAGNGTSDFPGDGGPASQASLNYPSDIFVDGGGNLYIADRGNNRIRKVDPSGIITTVVGNGTQGFSGDGGSALQASLDLPASVVIDGAGNLYIADGGNNRVRKVDPSGIITTVAGNGTSGFYGDGGPAPQASLNYPSGIFVDGAGNLYIADSGNNRVRKVDSSGVITAVAGNGVRAVSGDGGPATQASLNASGVFVDGAGNIYIADDGNHRIRKVDPSGIITTVAGTGPYAGYSGDGGPAIQANLNYPSDVFVDGVGNLYIADERNNRIRKVDPSGIITTVAGNGTPGFSGDGGLATQASLYPYPGGGMWVDSGGNLYIADSFNNRIRKVDPSGIITTVAGNGVRAFSGDGGPAIQASLAWPRSVFMDGTGNLYIADNSNSRIRRVDPAGIITTVAGNGNIGFYGDGGPATQASLSDPSDAFVDGEGNLYIADTRNNRIRRVETIVAPTLPGEIVTPTDTTIVFAAAKTFTVNSTGDSGDVYPGDGVCADGGSDCTLRAAIQEANAWAGTDTIRFDISGPAPHTISPGSTLPRITDPIVIDGTSEPDFAGVPVVELEGSRAGENVDGLHFRAGNSTVKGLVVNQFGTGIYLEINGNNVIQGNFIGTDITGTLELGNVTGLIIQDAPGNIIGGLVPEARNVISGNQYHGFTIIGERAMGNLVQGNYIGTDRTGTMDLGNRGVGVVINAPGNTIGGTTVMARNVIAGNDSAGVVIGGEATGNAVQGNFIGTDITGMMDLGNGSEGVVIAASNNTIGGREKGAGNIIAFNGRGVFVYSGSGNAILANAIHSNKGLGIDLRPDGVTANDADDRDIGANNLQNFPVLTAVSLDSGALSLSGTLNSAANTTFRLEFFASTTCGDSSKAEGKIFLDSLSAITDHRGQVPFSVRLSAALAPGEFVTATATPPDNSTSEFCACVSVSRPAVEPASKDSTDAAGSEAPPLEGEAVSILSGDFDQNGKVEFADFFLFADAFGGAEPLFDLDGSGSVEFADFFLFADHFGTESQAKLMDLAHQYIGLSVLPQLGQSFPNPFNNSTAICYQVVEHGQIRLELFDLMGQKVKTLVDDHRGPGVYVVSWDGTNGRGVGVSTGIYLVRLQVGAFTKVRKMALVK